MQTSKLFFLTASVLIICAMKLFPFERIQTNELADNPQGCPYYITLQSILANYPLMANDKANARFIQTRLVQFEHDLAQSTAPAAALLDYKKNYYTTLNLFGLQSMVAVNNAEIIIPVARSTYVNIDKYYFDPRVSCVNPLYQWKKNHSRRILYYNLGGFYYDQIPDKFARIQFAVDSGMHLGAFPGFFVNNQTTALGTQFMTGMPMLTALYVIPTYNYAKLGNYYGLVPWCAFNVRHFIDPLLRKVLNIAGIDIFTVAKTEITKRKLNGEMKKIPAAIPLAINDKQGIGADLQSYINTQSYGVAYLANHVTYENPSTIQPYERIIQQYFARPEKHDPNKFMYATNALYQMLMSLKDKQDILLEATQANTLLTNEVNQPAGSVLIKGMLAERIFLATDCLRTHCTLVLNISDAPGWHTFINGKSTTINRANLAFMATPVPQGKSIVWFIYEPLTTLISYLLSMLTLIAIVIASLAKMRGLTAYHEH